MSEPMTRRALLCAGAGSMAAIAAATVRAPAAAAVTRAPSPVRELEARVRDGMAKYGIPGVAVGLFHHGTEYVRGFGVTDLDNPVPVDGDTVFRVASTTKTFTGTAVMRLVERGLLDLGRPVRSYLPGFHSSDAAASARVTVREVLDHSAGWLGDFFLDTGTGDDALAQYVAAMSSLPQLTAPGTVFAYNNAALAVAGRLIEVVTRVPYEQAVQTLVTGPLGLAHSRYFLDDLPGASVAVPHVFDADGAVVAAPAAFAVPRSADAFGGLISSARDQLRWARFHLGDGRIPGGGGRLLTPRSMHMMQSHPGPGGTLFVELDGVGVTWLLRPTAEGPKVVQHGGDWTGEHSGFLMVPERGFALTVLTNSDGGPGLLAELFADDWALEHFAGVHNLPAVPHTLPDAELAAYEGRYSAEQIGFDGSVGTIEFDVVAHAGQLSVQVDGTIGLLLPFYRKDYVLILDATGADTFFRANFVRGGDGTVAWLRYGGRLYRRGAPAAAAHAAGTRLPLTPGTLPHPAR